MKQGMVYLIGAGPGDPDLISVGALRAIEEADCVIYDYLANPAFVERLSCEKIYVGKQGSDHTLPQGDINRLIVERAGQGKRVVRLKGGDPFIFGRGGEEAEELREAGIPFRIIPGISSFYSAPAYAGIPVTHRDFSDSFEVITGHRRADGSDELEVTLPDYNAHRTFVFLMGMKNLGAIAKAMIEEKGFPADTPAATISWGTTPRQKTAAGTLATIAGEAEKAGVKAPAIIIIGGVVGLRGKLRWFDTLPLFGKKIVVTRTREQASVLTRRLAEQGADVIEFPTIRIHPKEDTRAIDEAIAKIGSFDWIIFTSQNAVGIFFGRLKASGRDARALAKSRIAAIGPATAKELGRYSIIPDLVPEEFVAEGILEAMKGSGLTGKRILLPCAAEARPKLADELRAMGAEVERIHIYDTVVPDDINTDLLDAVRAADMVTFTSSSTANNFFSIVGSTGARLACIGPVTADAVRGKGYEPAIVAKEYTIDGLVDEILAFTW